MHTSAPKFKRWALRSDFGIRTRIAILLKMHWISHQSFMIVSVYQGFTFLILFASICLPAQPTPIFSLFVSCNKSEKEKQAKILSHLGCNHDSLSHSNQKCKSRQGGIRKGWALPGKSPPSRARQEFAGRINPRLVLNPGLWVSLLAGRIVCV